MISFAECSARERLALLLDAGSFHEWLPPVERVTSPHLAQLGVPSAFDDGVAIGRATLDGHTVFVAAQEGEFMGGGVGEVHGAKLVGLLQRALRDRPAAVLLLAVASSITSRLPEPTTPTRTGAKPPAGCPPAKEKFRDSIPAGTSLILNLPATSF